jgi:hypothetical protein
MRVFAYNELGEDKPVRITEKDIYDTYYDYWSGEMLKAHKSPMITEENFLEDFCVVHWAWEIKE